MGADILTRELLDEYVNEIAKIGMLRDIRKLIKEPSFANIVASERAPHWNGLCLDTTHYALSTIKRFFNTNDAEEFLLKFFDESSGGFRHHLDSVATCYATDNAYRLMYYHVIARAHERLAERFNEEARRFLLSCQDTNHSGAFSDMPKGPPSLSSTVNAYFAFERTYELEGAELADAWECALAGLRCQDKLMNFILRCKKHWNNCVGFSDDPERIPSVCSTAFALKLLKKLKELEMYVGEEEGKRIATFIDSCWVKKEGGYDWSSRDRSSVPTLVHTRWAIEVILTLLDNEILHKKDVTINADKILQYIQNCQSDGGFSFTKNSIPTVYSTRCVAIIFGYLKRLKEDYELPIRDPITLPSEKIEKFLDTCKDSKTGYYAGVPLKVELESMIEQIVYRTRRTTNRLAKKYNFDLSKLEKFEKIVREAFSEPLKRSFETIELKNSEVDRILKPFPFLIDVLKEKGIREQDAEKMYQDLLEYVETKVQEKQLKLTDETKKALANLMVLVAKKFGEETLG